MLFPVGVGRRIVEEIPCGLHGGELVHVGKVFPYVLEITGPQAVGNGVLHHPVEYEDPFGLHEGLVEGRIGVKEFVEELHDEDHIGGVGVLRLSRAHVYPEGEGGFFSGTFLYVFEEEFCDVLPKNLVFFFSGEFGIIEICDSHHTCLVGLKPFVKIDPVGVVVVLNANHSGPGPVLRGGELGHPVE